MKGKGQISVFVIVGVIILVFIIVFFLINGNHFNREKIEVSKIERFVEGCIEKEGMNDNEK